MTSAFETDTAIDRWDYEPPVVSWEPTELDGRIVGYHPNPPFGRTWPHIKTLQHHAALIGVRTGIDVRVVAAETVDELFEIRTGHSLQEAKPYIGAVTWLAAFEQGIREHRWHIQEQQTARAASPGPISSEVLPQSEGDT